MTSFHGDLVFPDVHPIELASTLGSDEIARGLTSLAELARELGDGEVWSDAELFGIDRSVFTNGPSERGGPGVSLAWAHLPGIGFEREERYVAEVPPLDEPGLSPIQQFIRQRNQERFRAEVRVRAPQIAIVRRLVEAARTRLPFPVAAAIGFDASWVSDFRAVYLRRIAYGLGFEASLRAGSRAPYETHHERLAVGSPREFEAALPPHDDPQSFSVHLNLLGTLEEIAAWEREHEGAAEGLPGRLVEHEGKRALLMERLARAAARRTDTLHDEGRLVVTALVDEAHRLTRDARWFNGALHDWSEARVPDPGRWYGTE